MLFEILRDLDGREGRMDSVSLTLQYRRHLFSYLLYSFEIPVFIYECIFLRVNLTLLGMTFFPRIHHLNVFYAAACFLYTEYRMWLVSSL